MQTERLGWVINTPDLYLRSPGLDSDPGISYSDLDFFFGIAQSL